MDFEFDDEQQSLQETLRKALGQQVPVSKIRSWSDDRDFSEFALLAQQQGWPGIGLDEARGGQGGGLIERTLLFEELGRACAPSGDLLASAMVMEMAMHLPNSHDVLAMVGAGAQRVALAQCADRPLDQEFGSGFEVDRGSLAGSQRMVLNADAADIFVVPVRSGDVFELWLAEGESVQKTPRLLVDQTRSFADIVLDRHEAALVGTVTYEQLRRVAAVSALLVSAESLGLARRMLEMTVNYVVDRRQFGVAVGSFQAVKHAAAQVFVDIEAAQSGIYYTAWALQNDAVDAELHAWIVKGFVCDAGARAADVALQLHGAIGYTWEYDLQLFFKRAKANSLLLGSSRTYRERVASHLQL